MKNLRGIAIILFLLAGQAHADQITLKNNDRITGKIVRAEGGKLLVKSELLGDLTVELTNVTDIASDQPLYVTMSDGRTIAGILTITPNTVELRPTKSGAVRIHKSDIRVIRSETEQAAYLKTLNPGWLEQWSGGADFGLALTSGNSDTTNVALGLAMTRATTNDKTSVYAASDYSRETTNGVSHTVANTIRGGVRYDRDINRKLFGYGFSDLEHNGLQSLTLRFVIGGGLGYHAIRNERTELDLLGGLDWNREYFKGDLNDHSSAEAQVGQTLTHRLSSRVSFKEQLFFFPSLSDTGRYRINFDAGLTTDITKRIGWHFTVSDHYLSNPPPGFKKNDLLLTTGLKVKLGTPK
jgi:putative salt-induced outer membrane protein